MANGALFDSTSNFKHRRLVGSSLSGEWPSSCITQLGNFVFCGDGEWSQ